MSWTGNLVSSYMRSEWANNRRALNEPQAREELLSGARLYCFEAGTNMPTPMFMDTERTTALPNPAVLSAGGDGGRVTFPAASFRLTITRCSGDVIATIDNCGDGFDA